MSKTNILILSAGRRVDLLNEFKTELTREFSWAKVYAVDLKPHLSSACQYADEAFIAPPVVSEDYIPYLLQLCEAKEIAMVIPTIDTELMALAQHREAFEKNGVSVIISSPELVEACGDKLKTAELFKELHIDSPEIYPRDGLKFPCFVKPMDGSCSIGAKALFSPEEVSQEMVDNPRNMFMELVPSHYQEYTIDAYFDRHGKLKCFVPRERLETRAGEISKGVTRRNHVYFYIATRLNQIEGAKGCITFQLFVDEQKRDYQAIEINPRFGGGYPLSYGAGANFPRMLIQEYLLNEEVDYSDSWENNMLMLRYDAKVLVHNYES